jgi:primosomal replication protein N
MFPNFSTVTGTIHEEPHYGFTAAGVLYCRIVLLWEQAMTDKTVKHAIPVLLAGPCAETAKTSLQEGQLVKISGRLSAPNGTLKFIGTTYQIMDHPAAENPKP